MTQTLTIRLPGPALRRLRARALSLRTTPSELVRRMLDREIGGATDELSAFELTQRWVGAVKSAAAPAGRSSREVLGQWSPDRRD